MEKYIGCDAHKRYSVFVVIDDHCRVLSERRVSHDREEFRSYLAGLPPGSEIALEAGSVWYWIVDEMLAAGHHPHLAQPLVAKKRMGRTNKTDRLDAKGLACLLRGGWLPEVWVAPTEVRDHRHLLRMRMSVRTDRTRRKCRVHGVLTHYGLSPEGISDLFGVRGRRYVELCREHLPAQTSRCVAAELEMIDQLGLELKKLEGWIAEVIGESPAVGWLKTIPGVGPVLGPVIAVEIGEVSRFGRAEQLASYSGLVPRVYQSGDKTVHGSVAPNVNRYLKWAFVEAANVVVTNRKKLRWRHTVKFTAVRL